MSSPLQSPAAPPSPSSSSPVEAPATAVTAAVVDPGTDRSSPRSSSPHPPTTALQGAGAGAGVGGSSSPSGPASPRSSGTASPASGGSSSRRLTQTPSSSSIASASDTRVCLEGKLVVVGEMNVGKTCLVSRWNKGEFDTKVQPSIGVAYIRKTVVVDNLSCKLNVWDTAGQERFRSINSLYYRKAASAVIVYDITSKASFETIPYWLGAVRKNAVKGCIIAIAGNKCDIEARRKVTREEAEEFAKENGVLHCETSAKTGVGVEQLFQEIVRLGPRHVQDGVEEGFRVVRIERGKMIDIAGEEKKSSKICC